MNSSDPRLDFSDARLPRAFVTEMQHQSNHVKRRTQQSMSQSAKGNQENIKEESLEL